MIYDLSCREDTEGKAGVGPEAESTRNGLAASLRKVRRFSTCPDSKRNLDGVGRRS
jgi:hypothetical protein